MTEGILIHHLISYIKKVTEWHIIMHNILFWK